MKKLQLNKKTVSVLDKKALLTAFILVAISFVACNSDDNNNNPKVNPYDKYKGEWKGTYSGDTEGGIWIATIDNTGKATGTLSSSNISFDLKGQLSEDGEMNAEYTTGTTVVGTMTGTITETTASGTWNSPLLGIQGTWVGNKN